MGTNPLVVVQVEIIEIVVKETNAYKDKILSLFVISQGFQRQNPMYEGGNVKGVR